MAHRLASRSSAFLAAGSLIVSLLAGCGTSGMLPTAAELAGSNAQADATVTLMKSFRKVHLAIFDMIDADHNRKIDEYEAGPHISLSDFQKADRNRDHHLSFTEFEKYATTNLLVFHDNASSYTARIRGQLGAVFNKLDTNHDGLLDPNTELTDDTLAKIKLSFNYPRLNISLPIVHVDDAAMQDADHTGDGKLSQAEFEDWYLDEVTLALGGSLNPAPQPSDDPGPAPNPGPSDGPAPAPGPSDAPAPGPNGPAPGPNGPSTSLRRTFR